MLRQSLRSLAPADRLSDRCRPGMLPRVGRGCPGCLGPHPVDVRVLCCPGRDQHAVRLPGLGWCPSLLDAGPVFDSASRPTSPTGRRLGWSPRVALGAVPYDHNSPQDLSVLAILSFKAVSRADRRMTSTCRPSRLVSPTGPDRCCFFQVPLTRLGALASGESFGQSSSTRSLRRDESVSAVLGVGPRALST